MNISYDKEYLILSQIESNPDATQRDISRHTGLSLGSVNLLLKKMTKEGLIKIESIPAHRVAYMLTPKGMVEKANKTVSYIKRHYNAITQTKEHIKNTFANLLKDHSALYIFYTNDEVGSLIITAIDELSLQQRAAITLIQTMEEAINPQTPVIKYYPSNTEGSMNYANPIINLLDKLP
ncbi:winged helix-turn-helix transcriptional regulator [Anoxynatronum buryatiense]|uniref:Winged helix-turn-helix DNA-binding n=1 Tax=Anoxynatronum buryatiense TaxID=489973 RepID=A0AA45WW27_9CLOT|nr:winged helix-turn-helix transcriptional regulator [Anoxynatronum buryatiense]SMP56662.1 Winged helix-turn-helix DNA-binding [Anoxynatronum buryatiense]